MRGITAADLRPPVVSPRPSWADTAVPSFGWEWGGPLRRGVPRDCEGCWRPPPARAEYRTRADPRVGAGEWSTATPPGLSFWPAHAAAHRHDRAVALVDRRTPGRPPDAAFAVPRTDEYKAELCAAPLARVRLGGGRGTLLKKLQTRPTPSQPFAWGVSRGGEVAGGRRGGRPPFSFSPPSLDGQSHRPVRRSRAVAPPATRTCEWGVDRWSPIAYCAASLQ